MNTVLNIPNCDVTMMARVVEPDKGDLSMAEWACASQAMARIAEFVRQRAGGVCEYCRVPDGLIPARHQLDHIIAHQAPWFGRCEQSGASLFPMQP